MKITVPSYINNQSDLDSFKRYTQIFLTALINDYNGRVSLTENCLTRLVSATFIAANTQVQISHNLGFAPNGYIQTGANNAMSLFDGTTANTGEFLYLQSSSTGVARVLVF